MSKSESVKGIVIVFLAMCFITTGTAETITIQTVGDWESVEHWGDTIEYKPTYYYVFEDNCSGRVFSVYATYELRNTTHVIMEFEYAHNPNIPTAWFPRDVSVGTKFTNLTTNRTMVGDFGVMFPAPPWNGLCSEPVPEPVEPGGDVLIFYNTTEKYYNITNTTEITFQNRTYSYANETVLLTRILILESELSEKTQRIILMESEIEDIKTRLKTLETSPPGTVRSAEASNGPNSPIPGPTVGIVAVCMFAVVMIRQRWKKK